MIINKNGYWEDENPKHLFDRKLCYFITDLLKRKKIESLVDFGCGDASYTKYFLDKDIICEAYDGNPNTEKITNGIGKVLDFSLDFNLDKKFDCVLSLEVGEHIPEKYEQNFINNITKHTNKLLILSWAVPNQGGDGHFNEKENRYIINEIEKRNFKVDSYETINLRKQSTLDWFKHTVMVFNYAPGGVVT